MSPAGKSNACTAAAGTFELTTFFDGRTRAWGIFEDRFGSVRRRFSVVMEGQWQGDTFVIDEEFVYDTGESEHRSWSVTPQGEGQFRARAADCIGEAIGRSDAEHIHMTYKLRLQMTGRTLVVDFDDRFAILEFIILRDRGAGQLALLADRHKAHRKLVGDGPTKDEAARFKADDLVDALACKRVQHLVNCHPKAARIRKKRRHITEHDPFMREIDDRANIVPDVVALDAHVGAVVDQQSGCLGLSVECCEHQRRVAVGLLAVHLGTGGDILANGVRVALHRGDPDIRRRRLWLRPQRRH